MTDHGLVSIITPSYNCADYIEDTIKSIQSQTYTNWEMLITDDCSTDNSCAIIEQYARSDSRIKLFHLEKNSGAGVARNNSIGVAKGRFIAFCDSDDRWYPNKLAKQLEFLKRTNESIAYSSYTTCDEEDRQLGIVVAYKTISYKEITRDDSIGFLTCIYNAEKLGKIYMPALRKRQDWGLKIILLKKARRAVGIIEPLAIYRIRRNSLSNKKFNLVKYNIQVYKDVLGYPNIIAWLKFLFDFMPHYIAKRLRLRIINQ